MLTAHLVCADVDEAFDAAVNPCGLQQHVSAVRVIQRESQAVAEGVVDVGLQVSQKVSSEVAAHAGNASRGTMFDLPLAVPSARPAQSGSCHLSCKVHDSIDLFCLKHMTDQVSALDVCLHKLQRGRIRMLATQGDCM